MGATIPTQVLQTNFYLSPYSISGSNTTGRDRDVAFSYGLYFPVRHIWVVKMELLCM